ncbi:MAG: hypothetical protein ACKOWG_16425 [Planctomycetia bacterium]
MTPMPMNVCSSLDAVDRAFLFHADKVGRQHPSPPPSPSSSGLPSHSDGDLESVPADDGQGTLVERLLRVVPDAWARLAGRVEDARRDGAEVIAIAGGRRGEGRTTLVECLTRTLAARGRRVESHARVPLELTTAGRDGGRIVLVDAGVWFPGGPLRRAWLERQSLGCHAVILVRRAADPACAARGTALEAVGLKVLGEVVTMAPPATSGIQIS